MHYENINFIQKLIYGGFYVEQQFGKRNLC